MPCLDFILNTLQVKGVFPDPDFPEPSKVIIKGKKFNAFHLIQDSKEVSCPHCSGGAIRYGFTRVSHVRVPDFLNLPALFAVRKRRYRCTSCSKTFQTESNLTDRHCFISNITKSGILTDLKKQVSMKYISMKNRVSDATVFRILHKVDARRSTPPVLPEVLMMDEFRSVSTISNVSMSFSLMDGIAHKLLYIVDDRKLQMLSNHFSTYPESERRKVKYVCMDMHKPYMQLCRKVFPQAKIVIDRFHVIQLVSRALNSFRVSVMKKVSHDRKLYKIFKRYWRLVLKSRSSLQIWKATWVSHLQTYKTEDYLLERMLETDDRLRTCYWLYQTLLSAIRLKSRNLFEKFLKDIPDGLPQAMKEAMDTIMRYRRYIVNSIECSYSNGPMEAMNNNFKVLKRIAYGYRNLENFKKRIYMVYTDEIMVA